jgi:ATP-dependent DNA helicase RecG
VAQREAVRASWTNLLEATATPIPRTAALAVHGSTDLHMLHEIPVDKKVDTRIFDRSSALEARNSVLRAIVERGEQAAVVYPMVEATEEADAKRSVMEAINTWSRYVAPEKIAVLHGRLSDEEKMSVLESFRAGERRLLLASTVIEVGVTLPELKAMLVIGAERFGVLTLHQLRGRLARHGGHGEFALFSESADPEALERLNLLIEHSDGFTLAERDAQVRGYGDLLGIDGDSQSGSTRTLFQGANVGPREIAFAANLYEKLTRAHATTGPAPAQSSLGVAPAQARTGTGSVGCELPEQRARLRIA